MVTCYIVTKNDKSYNDIRQLNWNGYSRNNMMATAEMATLSKSVWRARFDLAI